MTEDRPTREEPQYVILEGVVGSTAYNLATPTSDRDRLGVFLEPTISFLSLDGVPEKRRSWVGPKAAGDRALHEVGKYCDKLLGGNPTYTELLWLPGRLYQVVTDLGLQLIGLRSAFLSAKAVEDSYLGYAVGQFSRLEGRKKKAGEGEQVGFSSDLRKQTEKHARHMLRLLVQGFQLWETGQLTVSLTDMEAAQCRAFGQEVAELASKNKPIAIADEKLAEYRAKFAGTRTALPERPDREGVDAWLKAVRLAALR